MAEASRRAALIRNKQLLRMAVIGLAVIGISVFAAMWLQSAPKHESQADKPKTKSLSLANSATEKEAWRIQSQAELDKMKARLKELENKQKNQEDVAKRSDSEHKSASTLPPPDKAASAPVVPPPVPPASGQKSSTQNGLFTQIGTGTPPPPPTRSGVGPAPGTGGETPQGRIRSVSIEDGSVKADAAQVNGLVGNANKFGNAQAAQRQKNGGANVQGKTAETYLPAGSFVRASLLNGLDAPTGGQAQNNPNPVLLRLQDNAELPNAVRANLKGCFMTGSGSGDLSSERAYLRLDRMSCIDESGGAIDVAVRGYVSGEDGKTGLRGRLVTKSGQVIANALFVGVLGGFGEAIRQSSVSTNLATSTGAQTETVNNALQYGLGSGVGKAMDRIAQYYIKLADKLFPVIEIDAGRVVDIVLTQGVSIERK